MARIERPSTQVEDRGPGEGEGPGEKAERPAGAARGDAAPDHPPVVRKLLRRRERHKKRSKAYRAAWVAAGFLLIIGGLAIGILPGPGPVILVPLGLAMLALEFVWAERLLGRALAYFDKAKEGAGSLTHWQKALTVVLALMIVAATYAFAAWLWGLPGSGLLPR